MTTRLPARWGAVALAALLAVLCAPAASAAPENRDGIAVIIGNKTYAGSTPSVAFAHNDARAMRTFVIERLGYRPGNIIDLRDATLAQMRQVFGGESTHKGRLYNWVKAGKSSVVVFYSGHGVPGLSDGGSYLLPVDGDPNLGEISGYPLDLLYRNLARLEAKSVTVYLDACFTGGSHGGALVRNASGIVVTARPPAASPALLVVSAAESDQLASWDEEARLGLFTRHLLEALRGAADGAPYGDGDGMITAAEVKRYLDDEMTYQARRRHGRDQRATVSGDAETVLATVAPPGKTVSMPDVADVAEAAGPVEEMDVELVALKNANVRAGPSTSRSKLARIDRGARVSVTGGTADWYRVALADGRTGWVWRPLLGDEPSSARAAAGARVKRYRPGEAFKDCDLCPEMVAVPPGSFVMGSPPDEPGRADGEGPRRPVVIAGAMAVGKYEVTFAEWEACRADGGCGGLVPDDRGWGRGRRPVIGVSWRDAVAYADWLGRKTGRPYRLPSEAEWEYAARAGTTTPRFWGTHRDGACMFANVYDHAGQRRYSRPWVPYRCDDGYARTAPVGSFFVNRFGLHDMLGNVWEWVEDCWRPDHAGTPGAGGASTGDRCRRRVLRGGSWRSRPAATRSAARRPGDADRRDEAIGFRVVRALEGEFGVLRPDRDGDRATAAVRDDRRVRPRPVAPPRRRVVIIRPRSWTWAPPRPPPPRRMLRAGYHDHWQRRALRELGRTARRFWRRRHR